MLWFSGTRLRLWWSGAFWVVPTLGLLVGWRLQILVDRLDEALYGQRPFETSISASSASSLLAAVGGGMVTFTGLVFSFVMVILQFGSTAYSPRTVSHFLRSRSTQVILALFIATITYCFTAMISVGSQGRADFVPTVTVTGALVLLLCSLFGFIALLQITTSRGRLDRVLTDLRKVATERLPEWYVGEDRRRGYAAREPGEGPRELVPISYTGRAGQIVAVDRRRLLLVSQRSGGYLRMTTRVGDGLLPGDAIALVSDAHRIRPRSLSRCLVVSVERSLTHDPLYALRLLVDIAIRALSAAINDPTTAVRSIDEIESVLKTAARLPLGPVELGVGGATVVVQPPSWEDFLELALLEIIEFGAHQYQIGRRLTALLIDLDRDLPEERRPALERFRSLLHECAAERLDEGRLQTTLVPDRQGIGGSH